MLSTACSGYTRGQGRAVHAARVVFPTCLILLLVTGHFAAAGALRGIAPGLPSAKSKPQQDVALQAEAATTSPRYQSPSLYGTTSPKAYPGIFNSWSQVSDRATGVNATISDDPKVYGSFKDNQPTFFPAPSGQKSVFCLVRKCGSTRWVAALSHTIYRILPYYWTCYYFWHCYYGLIIDY